MANYWMHNGFLQVEGEKMSKSLGNFTDLLDLVAESDPRAYRLLVLRSHYRAPIEVTKDTVADAEKGLARLDSFGRRFVAAKGGALDPDAIERFRELMDDDLGTPAADLAAWTYNTLLKNIPLDACAPGDGQVLESLRPEARNAWIKANPLPPRVRYYSIAGFADRDRMARVLVPSWKYLNEIDRRNDGQVIASGAVIPGATLLGYVNSDHLGLAMHDGSHYAFFVGREDAVPFPTETLLVALIAFVADDP